MNSTQIRYHRRSLADVAQAMRLARTQVNREQQHRAQLAEHQQGRLEIVLRHAAFHSPFYRRWFTETGAAGKRPVDLANLPILTRPVLMEHFDELVCDTRLHRDELLDWVGKMTRDQLYLNRYRVLLTSGSSGRPGLFVYDAGGWRSIAAGFVRSASWCDLRPTVPRQRMAWIGGTRPSHITCQGAATMAIGLHQILSLPVTLPLPELVEALNRFQPTYLNVYPSVAMWLVDEQQAGRLQIRPRILATAAELRTPEMTEHMTNAFEVRPFDLYGCTEGLFGSECEYHHGIHLFEDSTLVENVDADSQPVPVGQPGARLLLTNLHNLVQPLIRVEVTDMVTVDPDPCPCGRTLIRAKAIHGRTDDVLSLTARGGGQVAVHPLQFALLTGDPDVREFQVRQDGHVIRILIVPRSAAGPTTGAGDDLETRLGQAVARQLAQLGARDPQVVVERRHELARSAGGKLQLVVADPATSSVRTDTA